MKRLVGLSGVLGVFIGLAGSTGCKDEPAPLPAGFVPGQRAAKRATPHLFELIQLEECDRIFGAIDEKYAPILESMKKLEEARKRLTYALEDADYKDLALMLSRKRLTSSPEPIDIVVGPVKQVGFEFGEGKAEVKLELPVPGGSKTQASTQVYQKGVGWLVKVPLTYGAGGKAAPSVDQIRASVDKAVENMTQVMEGLTKRFVAGEMIEASEIREKLLVAGRPFAAAMQQLIYGQTNIK